MGGACAMAIPDVASSIPTSNNERFVCMRTQLGPRASVPKMLARIQADQSIRLHSRRVTEKHSPIPHPAGEDSHLSAEGFLRLVI